MYKTLANTEFVGIKVIYLPECHSTNDYALDYLGREKAPEGTVAICSHQTAGRGQRGNVWEAEPDQNLTFSLIFYPTFLAASLQFRVNIAVTLGIVDGLKRYLPNHLKIKWPNDIYWNNQKVCGILIENNLKNGLLENMVVGIGVNVNQSEFYYEKANSLCGINGKQYDLSLVLEDLLISIEQRYLHLKNGGWDTLQSEYLSYLYWFQESHTFKDLRKKEKIEEFQGVILGVNNRGQLAVERHGSIIYFNFKEIQFLT